MADDKGINGYSDRRTQSFVTDEETEQKMGTSESRQSGWQHLAYGALLMAALAVTGCQVNVGGQTLPSPYYLSDDIQYFAPGPEFPLAREAAAAAVRKAELEELEDEP